MKKYQEVARELMVVERAAWWNPRVRRILKAAPLVLMFLLLNTRNAHAACSFSPAPSAVDGSANSLRAAVIAANASGQDCTIQLVAGTYTLTIENTNGQENHAAQGDLDITDSGHTVTIQGKGAGVSIVNANGIDRAFQVLGGANAVFSNLTIEGGIARDNGSAGILPGTTVPIGGGVLIEGDGNVTFSQVSIQGNQAIGGNGRNATSMTGKGAPGLSAKGAGIFLYNGTVSLTGSKVTGNAAIGGAGGNGYNVLCSFLPGGTRTCHGTDGPGGAGGAGAGGGLYVLSGNAQLLTSTVSGNQSTGGRGGQGGGLDGPETDAGLIQLGGNGGLAQGAGLYAAGGTLTVRQTTVSGNLATAGTAGSGGGPVYYNEPRAIAGASFGAGMFVASGNITLGNSTVFGNTGNGGGGALTRGSTVANGGNAAGGGLYLAHGSISLNGVTLASNQALGNRSSVPTPSLSPGLGMGGGIANMGAGLFTNTTVIGNNSQNPGNASNGDDVSGRIAASYSLIGQTSGATITDDGGNFFDVNPMLDPGGLRSNGGPTQTVALVQGSPADGTGDNPICKEAAPTGLGGIDQRGLQRFRAGDELCDIGAFQFITLLVQPFNPPSLSFGSEPVGHQTPSHTVSVTNNQTTTITLSRSVGGADPADFLVSTTCAGHLSPSASCSILITFHPKATGTRSATLTVSDSPDPTSPYHVTLTGVGS
jgi:hypothetical protein